MHRVAVVVNSCSAAQQRRPPAWPRLVRAPAASTFDLRPALMFACSAKSPIRALSLAAAYGDRGQRIAVARSRVGDATDPPSDRFAQRVSRRSADVRRRRSARSRRCDGPESFRSRASAAAIARCETARISSRRAGSPDAGSSTPVRRCDAGPCRRRRSRSANISRWRPSKLSHSPARDVLVRAGRPRRGAGYRGTRAGVQ